MSDTSRAVAAKLAGALDHIADDTERLWRHLNAGDALDTHKKASEVSMNAQRLGGHLTHGRIVPPLDEDDAEGLHKCLAGVSLRLGTLSLGRRRRVERHADRIRDEESADGEVSSNKARRNEARDAAHVDERDMIERLPTLAEDLRHYAKLCRGEDGDSGEERPRLNDDRLIVTFPDGTVEGLTPDQYRVVAKLARSEGEWLNAKHLPGSRPGYIIDGRPRRSGGKTGGLPPRTRKHIEGPNGPNGWRWRAPARTKSAS